MSAKNRRKGGHQKPKHGKERSRLDAVNDFFNGLVATFEKDRTNIFTMFLFLLALTVTSSVLESVVFEYPSSSLYLTANHVILKTAIFLIGCLILAHFASTHIRKVLNVALLGYWGILIPPLADKFLFGRSGLGQGYPFVRTSEFVRFFFVLFDKDTLTELASTGMVIQWLFITFLSGLYVAVKLGFVERAIAFYRERSKAAFRSFLNPVPRIIGVMFFIWLFIIVVSTHLDLIIYYSETGITVFTRPITVPISHYHFMDGVHIPQFGYGLVAARDAALSILPIQLFLFAVTYHLIVFLAATAFSAWRYDRELLWSFIKYVNWPGFAHFGLMAFLGIMAVRIAGDSFLHALDPLFPLHTPYVILAMLSVFFAWLFIDIGSGLYAPEPSSRAGGEKSDGPSSFNPEKFSQVAVFFLILSLCTGFLLGWITFLLLLCFLLLGILYILPPIRLKDRGFGPLFIASGTLLAFFIGFLTPSIWILKAPYFLGYNRLGEPLFDFQRVATVYIYRIPPLSPEVIMLCITLFLAAFFAGIIVLRGRHRQAENGT